MISLKKTIAIVLALICLSTVTALAEGDEERTITVTGNATILVDADSASVSLGVLSVAREASEASRLNAEQIDALIKALEGIGIERRDISTSYYYVSARRNYEVLDDNGDYAISGYEVSNNLSVTVRDIDKVGAVIDTALANGANSCNGVDFSASNSGETQDQALILAIGEAKRRAALIAEACGGQLGEILNVSENYSSSGILVNNTRLAMEDSADKGMGTQIISDGLSFSATVYVTFALKSK